MSIYNVKDSVDFNNQLDASGEKLIVVFFTATWSGPSKMISPKIEELSNELPDVTFLKVDTDELEDIAEKYDVSVMPTFVFIKNKAVVYNFSGANADKFKEFVLKYK